MKISIFFKNPQENHPSLLFHALSGSCWSFLVVLSLLRRNTLKRFACSHPLFLGGPKRKGGRDIENSRIFSIIKLSPVLDANSSRDKLSMAINKATYTHNDGRKVCFRIFHKHRRHIDRTLPPYRLVIDPPSPRGERRRRFKRGVLFSFGAYGVGIF